MKSSAPFLDSNVLLRHLTQDHEEHSLRATAILSRVESGELQARLADTVVFEVVFTLQRAYRLPKADIRDALVPLLDLPGLLLPKKERIRRALDLYVEANISYGDAYHAVLMRDEGITEVLSFDRDFDRVPWLRRIAP
jgi:uncharacterized protein